MDGRQRKWSCGLFVPLFLVASAAAAAPAARYLVSGPMGALAWGPGSLPGTQALLFVFSAAAPVAPSTAGPVTASAPPGPRVLFIVTQLTQAADGAWVQRQWSGDWPLAPKALAIAGDLTQGALDTIAYGTLQVSSVSGTVIQRNVPGRLQIQWAGSSNLAHTTLADSLQTPAFTVALQIAGMGRLATATGTLTVPALGAPIPLQSGGSLAAADTGLLTVALP